MSSPRRQNKGWKTQYVGREGHHSSDSCLLLHLRHLEMSMNDGEKFMSWESFWESFILNLQYYLVLGYQLTHMSTQSGWISSSTSTQMDCYAAV